MPEASPAALPGGRPTVRGFVGGWALLNLLPLLVVLLGLLVHPGAVAIVVCLAAWGVGAFRLYRLDAQLYAAVLLALPLCAVGSCQGVEYARVAGEAPTALARPTAAAEHDGVDVFVLESGGPALDRIVWGMESQPGSQVTHYAAVTPIVDPGWTPADPVPLWAVHSAAHRLGPEAWTGELQADLIPRWRRGGGAWLVARGDLVPFYRGVVATAEQQHGLRSAEEAPLVHFVESSAAAVADAGRVVLVALAVVNGAWLLGVPAFHLLRRRRRGRAPA